MEFINIEEEKEEGRRKQHDIENFSKLINVKNNINRYVLIMTSFGIN